MKRNKIMALTALLTLIGAPLSKAQETKGGSQQSTSAQSANKDSKAVDKTKDSKAPQQNKDSKTAEKTKEETKKDSKNAQQMKEQPKDSKKDGKKENKKSDVASNETLLNRMVNLGYSLEWIKKNWPWLAAIGGTGVVSGVAGNKMGKKANVDAKVDAKVQEIVNKGYMKNEDVAADYVLKTNQEGIKAAAKNFGIKYTDEELNNKAHQLAGDKKYTEDNLNDNNFLSGKNLVKKADLDQLVKNAKKEVDDEWKQKINKGELLENVDEDAIKKLADGIGIKYTDDELKKKIDAAVSAAKGTGLLTRIVDESKKKSFDTYVQGIEEQLQCSLRNIQKALGGSFQSIFAITTYSDEDEIPNDKVVDALNMLADIKNALVDKQASDFEASFANTKGTQDGAWSDFGFKLGSKEYDVYVKHTENKEICIKVDEDEYSISLENVEIEKVDGGEEEGD